MRTLSVLFTLLILACGDNTPSALAPDAAPPDAFVWHWRDAEAVWTDAWCTYAERCYPEQFEAYYGGTKESAHYHCVVVETAKECALPYLVHPCADLFPTERLDGLMQCHDQMADISCLATMAPDVCYAVWQ